MAQATNTTEGTIVLAGDLFGNNANQPELVHSGVVPGDYKPAKKIHVDTKGRLTWAGPAIWEVDLEPYCQHATKDQKGIFQVGHNITVSSGEISLPITSPDTPGVFQLGYGMTINQSTGAVDVSVQDATASNLGVVQVGSGLEVAAGILSRTGWGNGSSSVKGMVKIGANFNVDYGTISVPYASASVSGVAQVDPSELYLDTGDNRLYIHGTHTGLYGLVYGFSSDFSIDGNGVLSYVNPYSGAIASASTLGMVKIGDYLYMTGDNALSVAKDASTSDKGFVSVGTGFTVTSGVLSVSLSDNSTWGLACLGDTTNVYNSMAYNLTPINNPGYPENGTTGFRYRRSDTVNPANLPFFGVVRSANMDNISISNGVMDIGANIPKKDVANIYTGAQNVANQTLVDTDWSKGNIFTFTLTDNLTSVAAPVNAVNGQVITMIVKQDATGGRTMTGWNSYYKFAGAAPALSTEPNAIDIFTIIRKSSQEYYVLYSKGFQ